MSIPCLPPEILDYITDLLRDESETLKECCRVSKSWVPRTRRLLFAHIQLGSLRNLHSWTTVFSDPANSPAYHAHTLTICCPEFVDEMDAEEDGWIQTFSGVERLIVVRPRINHYYRTEVSLVTFRILSTTLKSLSVTAARFPLSQIFNLIYSLPLLEDLALSGGEAPIGDDDKLDAPSTAVPLTSPAFTGTLELLVCTEIRNTARRLLDLPNGLHFRKLELSWYDIDLQWVVRLVAACSGTLECLDVTYCADGGPCSGPIDLSTASKLKDIALRCGHLNREWVAKTLETITSQHQDLQQITVYPIGLHRDVREHWNAVERFIVVNDGTPWLDVDHLLVQLWDSRSIRPRVAYSMGSEKEEVMGPIWNLFPELTKRGLIDLVEYSDHHLHGLVEAVFGRQD